jgi:putative membrane protein
MKKISLALLTFALCATQACQSPENRSAESHESDSMIVNENENERKAGTEDHAGNITYKTNADDDSSGFMKDAAGVGMMEVILGELASKKASNPKVKAFGEQMMKDHTKANKELAMIAEKASVLLPTDLHPDHKKHYDHLSTLTGAEFDKQYIQMMVDDHQKTVELFRYGQDLNKQDLVAFAKETMPVIEQHYAQAKSIQASL